MSTVADTHFEGALASSHSGQLPRLLAAWLGLTIGLSSIVFFEPAPCDVLAAVGMAWLALTDRFIVPLRTYPIFCAGLALFVLANLVSLFASIQPALALRFAGITFYLVLSIFLFASMTAHYGRQAFEVIRKAFLFAALLTSAIGILAWMRVVPNWQFFFRDQSWTRIKGTFKDPNVFAPFLVAAFVLVLSSALRRGRLRLWETGALALLGMGILLAFSRGAYVHLVVSLAALGGAFVIATGRQQRVAKLALVTLPPILLLAGLIFWGLRFMGGSDIFFSRIGVQSYDSERFQMQRTAIDVASRHPLGIGPGQWSSQQAHRMLNEPHNVYLRVWAENGVLGLIGFLLFNAVWLYSCWRRIRRGGELIDIDLACFAIILGCLVESFFIDTLHWRHYFLFLGLPLGLSVYERYALPKPQVEQAE